MVPHHHPKPPSIDSDRMRRSANAPLTVLLGGPLVVLLGACTPPTDSRDIAVDVTLPESVVAEALDGRLILILSQSDDGEPRFHVTDGALAQSVFGLDVEAWSPGTAVTFADTVFGFPVDRLGSLPEGAYRAQAVLNRYETFERSDGHTVKLPPDRGEGQQWARKPGNLYSEPVEVTVGPGDGPVGLSLSLNHEIEPLPDPETLETEWVKYIRIRSDLLSDFWGTDMYLGAWVLLPLGFDEHPEARYPLAIWHGHFPSSFSAMRTEPPDTTEPCVYSARFDMECYNHVQQRYQHELHQQWVSPEFPRHLVVEIQHPTPYYDDSYAVNSENNGPYGDLVGDDGYPRRIWDKVTGEIDPEVAEHWRENYDLTHILQRDWETLGPKLEGKLHIYVGEMDNYYLNNAVYLAEDFLESTTEPYYGGEVDYGARDEHCWNGDPTRPNAISRLRYVQMFAPRMVERMEASHPSGADLTSWRY